MSEGLPSAQDPGAQHPAARDRKPRLHRSLGRRNPRRTAQLFNNDSFATAEYVSAPPDAGTGLTNSVVVDGNIQDNPQVNDKVDYYAIPLMSGQTITASVKEISLLSNNLDLGVFDPEGRLIYSDYNAGNQLQTEEKPFQFTTTEPGVYRFAVGEFGDSHFTGASRGNFGEFPYQLVVKNVGDLAIGAIVATGDIVDNPGFTNGFSAVNGDFGALVAGGRFSSFDGSNNTVVAENGNLRTIQAGTIGDTANGLNPEITVTFGSVGLVESTVGSLFFNDSFAPPRSAATTKLSPPPRTSPPSSSPMAASAPSAPPR